MKHVRKNAYDAFEFLLSVNDILIFLCIRLQLNIQYFI